MRRLHAEHPHVPVQVHDALTHLLRVPDLQVNAHPGIAAAESGQDRRQVVRGRRSRSDDAELPAREVARLLQRPLGITHEGEDPLRVLLEMLAGGGEPNAPPHAVEEPHAMGLLELPDLETDRGRRHVQPLRGAREAAGPRDRFEDPQLSEVDRHDGEETRESLS
jgi:hypothetical protein